MELYNAIIKMEQGGSADGLLQVNLNHGEYAWALYAVLTILEHCHFQVRVDRVQSDLEGLVKALNERCKKYGLRAKPTALIELPFGIFLVAF